MSATELSGYLKQVLKHAFESSRRTDQDGLRRVTAAILGEPITDPMSPLALAISDLGQSNLPAAVVPSLQKHLRNLLCVPDDCFSLQINAAALRISYRALSISFQIEASKAVMIAQVEPVQLPYEIKESLQSIVTNKLRELGVGSPSSAAADDDGNLVRQQCMPPKGRKFAEAINKFWYHFVRRQDAYDSVEKINTLKQELRVHGDRSGRLVTEIEEEQRKLQNIAKECSQQQGWLVTMASIGGALTLICGGLTVGLALGALGLCVTLVWAGCMAPICYLIRATKKVLGIMAPMLGANPHPLAG